MSDVLRLIKKYPNRRLYDPKTSAYITLAELKDFVIAGESFKVVDAKSGEDLTRGVLLQIVIEGEGGDAALFSNKALTQLVRAHAQRAEADGELWLNDAIAACLSGREFSCPAASERMVAAASLTRDKAAEAHPLSCFPSSPSLAGV